MYRNNSQGVFIYNMYKTFLGHTECFYFNFLYTQW